MSAGSVEHATFVVERRYNVSPERAFAAWADPEAKARWFVDSEARFELDFRVGGRERNRGTAPDGNAFTYEALYQDIVPAGLETARRRSTAVGMGSLAIGTGLLIRPAQLGVIAVWTCATRG